MASRFILENLRTHGHAPFRIAVIHGGPGAPGEMAPVARKMPSAVGVLEPMQTASSVDGQVEELCSVLQQHGDLPMVLVGYSWGAWLSFIVTARYPGLVRKLVLVSSGPFEEKYAADIMQTRLDRLCGKEKTEALALINALDGPVVCNKDELLGRFGRLMSQSDAYDPVPTEDILLECSYDINTAVWAQAAELRRSGLLLEYGNMITCPVVAIHGDYDPHPAEGVEIPLSNVLQDFRFILLEKCGHTPWLERQAKDRFYEVLGCEIST